MLEIDKELRIRRQLLERVLMNSNLITMSSSEEQSSEPPLPAALVCRGISRALQCATNE
jgi:hypothetical protein